MESCTLNQNYNEKNIYPRLWIFEVSKSIQKKENARSL
jgi:hypothetical protein